MTGNYMFWNTQHLSVRINKEEKKEREEERVRRFVEGRDEHPETI